MRRVRLIGLAAAVFLLQVGFVPALRPLGVVPDLVLVLVILVGLAGTATAALAIAVAGGLLLDLNSGNDFGLRLGLLVVAALVASHVHRAGLTLVGPIVAMLLVTAATVIQTAVVLSGLAGGASSWPVGAIVVKLGFEMVLNLSLTWVLRPLVDWSIASEVGSRDAI